MGECEFIIKAETISLQSSASFGTFTLGQRSSLNENYHFAELGEEEC
jgi:hypothetical protein